jgi:predicted metal-dependent HD superfamily phosphohydrolase
MPIQSSLLDLTRRHVEALFTGDSPPSRFFYHTLAHTREVVEAAEAIGRRSGLDKKDLETVLLAAWFHDAGFPAAPGDHHEHSVGIASAFLTEQGLSPRRIDKVAACIRATKVPQSPQTLPERVLCDADLAHLGSKTYFQKAELLRAELAGLGGTPVADGEWLELNKALLQNHVFFTEYARKALSPGQAKNLRKLEKQTQLPPGEAKRVRQLEGEVERLTRKLEEEKHKFGRGIETMFRTTSRNHLELSAIADNKANIMISINAIIVSLIVSVLMRKFEEFPNFIVPTAILTVVCLSTIVFAILATRPGYTRGTFNPQDVARQKTNLLFFGNFHKMELESYESAVRELIKSDEQVYTGMIHDIYFLGKALGRKYYLIRWCYLVFMYGFVLSVLAYAVALFFFPVEG